MSFWSWYWHHYRQHKPKALCSHFIVIDSFSMFKNAELVRLVKESKDRMSLMIPTYDLVATLQDDNSLHVQFKGGSYSILVERKPCHFGGFYHFFHCPACKARLRKLYCIKGIYVCRRCAHLGYYSQRLTPAERCFYMMDNVEKKLMNLAGSLEQKPPWIKRSTFQKLRIKYVKYDEKHSDEVDKELLKKCGYKGDMYFPPSEMFDAYVERDEPREEFF